MDTETRKQLDIMHEAIMLMNEAKNENHNLTIAEALEILKIYRLDILTSTFDTFLSSMDSSLCDIAYPN